MLTGQQKLQIKFNKPVEVQEEEKDLVWICAECSKKINLQAENGRKWYPGNLRKNIRCILHPEYNFYCIYTQV